MVSSLSSVQPCASLTSALTLMVFLLMFFGSPTPGRAIPAFARKYGLPCSACHEAWPMLNTFGQTFKDNGYQLMNDRDSPIWQNPSYWPSTFRMTPNWHLDSTNKVAIDQPDGTQVEKNVSRTASISAAWIFSPAARCTRTSRSSWCLRWTTPERGDLESANARIDNIGHSPWFNFKLGKFELDNIISEKRILTLSNNGGYYVLYHFIPAGIATSSARWATTSWAWRSSGHSLNDRTRYSVALLSSNDGNANLPSKNAYSTFITASQAFDAGYEGGVDRVGGYLFIGNGPTYTHNILWNSPYVGRVTSLLIVKAHLP